jgi:small neutral amino acid transporter SnatA (MarC family)
MRAAGLTMALAAVLLLGGRAVAAEKAVWHYVSVPIIEGTGIFASVASLADNGASANTTAAAITNLGLMATEGTLGLITAFLDGDGRRKMRTVHRVMGFVLTAAGLWLGIANSVDHADAVQQATSYSYAALTTVPIIMFSF